MKIAKIEIYLVRIPFRSPFRFADTPLPEMEAVIVRMDDQEGRSGWGEVFPGNQPLLTAAWSSGVFHTLKDCILPLLGTDISIDSGDHLAEQLRKIQGNRHAKGALDMAFWDLYSKRLGKPLHEAIGGKRKEIELGLVFDRYEDVNPFMDDLNKAVSEGYKRISLKIRPGWDLSMLRIVRAELSTVMLQCDLEGALNLEQHTEMLYRFDDFFPSLLEQPLSANEYVGHAMLQDGMRTNIGLDESITTLHQAQIAFDLQSGNTFCIKPGKVGGLTETMRINDACAASDFACYSGCDCATSIGYRFVAAAAALSKFTLPADYLHTPEVLSVDFGEPLVSELAEDGNGKPRRVCKLWTGPGIGFEPDRELLEKHAALRFTYG
ncbi:MAG: hypothetical protein FWC43_06160 [Planctomycetaceae bacterium]|nr:hypothetical protein [Planctomycetaceae bacterium]